MNKALIEHFNKKETCLVAVSKTRTVDKIQEVYDQGIRDFGENRVQEFLSKKDQLPEDIRWHLIGHLQTKKVKSIIDFVYLIHSVDRISLLDELQKHSANRNKQTKVLLQFKVATEETKYGFDSQNFYDVFNKKSLAHYPNIEFCGIMAMASFVSDQEQIKQEFNRTKEIFEKLKSEVFNDHPAFAEISMGMSGDYELAIETGSTMVRIGSLLFN